MARHEIGDAPAYDELPTLDGTDERHSWDVFGRDDEFGCLNFITPARTLAAVQEVSLGRTVNLNLPVGEPQPQFWADRGPVQHTHVRKRNLRDDRLDSFEMQGSTQWDGLRHQRYREHGWFGGRQEREIDELGQLGIERWAERGIFGRGVLADVARYREEKGDPLPPDRRFPIDGVLLDEVLDWEGVELREGDVLLVRTGWLAWYRDLDDALRSELAAGYNADRSTIALPGLDPSQATAAWLWNRRIAAIALDNPTAETVPYVKEEGWAHMRLLPLLGLPLGELWLLDELGEFCAAEKRYSFLIASAPINLPGGAGSPANAYALM